MTPEDAAIEKSQRRTPAAQGDDAALARAFAARRPEALERAYRAYSALLFSVARHILGTDHDAMDCVHDALMRIWQRPNAFLPERGSLRAYLSVCVRNEALSRRRAAARHSAIERRLVAAEAITPQEPPSLEECEVERLHGALETLPPEQRSALELAYYRYYTHTQIASALNVPLGTVKSRLKLALRRLSAQLVREREG